MNIKSNLDKSEYGRFTFSCGDLDLLYLPWIGFAAAKMEVLALSQVVIPALAIDTVYYSITSWIETQSCSSILSNSSMQQIPLSAKTNAPPSKTISLVVGSQDIVAVKPAPEEPLPVV